MDREGSIFAARKQTEKLEIICGEKFPLDGKGAIFVSVWSHEPTQQTSSYPSRQSLHITYKHEDIFLCTLAYWRSRMLLIPGN